MKIKAPKAPAEDPEAKAARLREQSSADAAYVAGAQDLLDDETRRRIRRFGRRGALAGVGPGGGGFGGVGGSGSYVPIFSGGATGGFTGGGSTSGPRGGNVVIAAV